ncbi:MAG: hypothetical protein OIF50_11905, partial [Flavobacteriaceae bacterium]|nr:hypothetical protein [Flavobacteriaceae bacterium]
MKKRKSAFIAFLLLVLCIGGFTALSRYYKPHINVANRDAQIRIDSGKLIAAFQEDEDTANAQYLDRIVQVKGSITELDA